jgi:hypothetical protein
MDKYISISITNSKYKFLFIFLRIIWRAKDRGILHFTWIQKIFKIGCFCPYKPRLNSTSALTCSVGRRRDVINALKRRAKYFGLLEPTL